MELYQKNKKKNFLGFVLQDITPWNHKNMINCYFGEYFGGLGTNVEFNGFVWFCEFLKIWASIFWLKTVLTLFFSLILIIFQGVSLIIILRSDYRSVRWYWCKKDQQNLPKISHKIFSQCWIMNSSLLWAFIVQNF